MITRIATPLMDRRALRDALEPQILHKGRHAKHLSSFVSQRNERIDFRRASCGDVTGEQRDHTQQDRARPTNVSGSVAVTPKSISFMTRVTANAPATPITKPTASTAFPA
jgi:hypothetical protein